MDIAVSSNFERYLFDLWGRDPQVLVSKFFQLRSEKFFTITDNELESARHEFKSFSVDEKHTLGTIASVYRKHGYLLCPHSAVGYAAAESFISSPEYHGETIVTLATAHIGKFTENILSSVRDEDVEFDKSIRSAIQSSIPDGLAKLHGVQTRRVDIENSVDEIKTYLRKHVHNTD
jgi:threonine synthase